MKILDGKKVSEQIKKELAAEVIKLKKRGITPGLAFYVSENPEAQSYVRIKERVARELGIKTLNSTLKNPTTEKIISVIKTWNRNKNIHGILVQLPLPRVIDKFKVLDSIDPKKDVDGLTSENQARLYRNSYVTRYVTTYVPATPLGVLALLERNKINVPGKNVVIIGRSLLVGKPLAQLLINRDATVTVAHSKTKNIKALTKTADILISAAGSPKLIKKDWIKKGAVVVDVGISKVGNKLVGDVDFQNVKKIASYISPVPGGVGPMTVVMLLKNVIQSAQSER